MPFQPFRKVVISGDHVYRVPEMPNNKKSEEKKDESIFRNDHKGFKTLDEIVAQKEKEKFFADIEQRKQNERDNTDTKK